MTLKTSLLAGVGASLALALGLASAADAKPVKRHRRPAAEAPAWTAPDPRDEEIRLLKEQNASLNARLTAVEQAMQQTQTAAQEAQAAAVQAKAAADDGIKRIPGEVKTQVAAIPKPKPGWEASTSISGRMYYNVSYIGEKTNGVTPAGARNGANFDIKRFYLGVDHKFNDTFSANLTTDVTFDSGPVASTQIFIKKAYLQARFSDALTVRLGAADLPWVPFVEDIYGYRYVEQVMIDRDKFGTSADWGVHAMGSLPVGMVKVNYAVSAINGQGYRKPGFGTINRSQGVDFEGRLSATAGHVVAAVGGYAGKLGGDVKGVPTYHTATRFDALVAYTDDKVRLGGEYFHASNWNDVRQANPLLTNDSEGVSVFGSYKLTPQVAVFGKYEWVKPRKDTAPGLDDNYFNVGVSYSPAKIVDFALVYKRDRVENGTLSTGNGTIGGSLDGTYDEVGLWGQFRW